MRSKKGQESMSMAKLISLILAAAALLLLLIGLGFMLFGGKESIFTMIERLFS